MEEEFVQKINKEFYKAQIESAANNLINRADEILEDWDKGISNINIEINVNPCAIATLKVTKQYTFRRIDMKGEK